MLSVVSKVVALTTTSIKVADYNERRAWLLLINDDNINDVYVGMGKPAVVGQGPRLNYRGSNILFDKNAPYEGEIHAISAVSANLIVVEVSF